MANGDTIMKYIVPVIGAIVVALQGVNLHNTGDVERVVQENHTEAVAELKLSREDQDAIKQLVAEVHDMQQRQSGPFNDAINNFKLQTEQLSDINKKILELDQRISETASHNNLLGKKILDKLGIPSD